ncbi:UDP-N-acetylmuramoyl-tripeptide--D-alanyl-D-alanine ligase [Marinicrinis sediminis]|uniref:UDP-N-acetylmuramoyl-tripeptide--D-alanyl-D-alanine ligase n=1 Tax=Marinicrinis sediminis TaxID=1652465 RepID=A0ABW5RB91_9BACL
MIKRTLIEIQQMIEDAELFGPGEQRITGVQTDSRNIQEGCLFIPLVGEHFNGHDFVAQAIEKGASAALWQEDQGQPPEGIPLVRVQDTLLALQQLAASYRRQHQARVIGVTGSNGKTTTKDLVAAILETTYHVHKTDGNYNNHIGLPLTILSMDEKVEMAVLEMGMSGRGEIELLSELAQPEAAIITNIGEAHLLQLGSREEIARAKLEILSRMKPDGLFVFPGDEPLIRSLFDQEEHAALKYISFGESTENDLYPISMMQEEASTLFMLNTHGLSAYRIPLLGKHNVINAIAAIAVCKYMGVSEKDVVRGLKQAKITGMRIEKLQKESGLTILNDCYNASPASMKAAIELVSEMPGYRHKGVVLGDMLELGEKENEYHREIGQILDPKKIDWVYTFGPLAEYIAEEASNRYPLEAVQCFASKQHLIEALQAKADKDTIVLVKGSRGMKLEEVIDGIK